MKHPPQPPGYPYHGVWPVPQPMPGTTSDMRRRLGTQPLPLARPAEAGQMGPRAYYQEIPMYPPQHNPHLGQPAPPPITREVMMDPNYIGNLSEEEFLRQYTRVPAWYPITIDLGQEVGNNNSNGIQIRPEPFWLKRITWASTGGAAPPAAIDTITSGRSVEIEWSDEFVKFLGSGQATLLSALMGDSEGFLDIPGRVLFQGRQTLTIELTRVRLATVIERFDILFHGLGLLPRGMQQSGSSV